MMSNTRIDARIIDQSLQLVNTSLVASGSKGALQIRCEFDSLWDGYGKTAVFYKEESEVFHVPVVDGLATVPHEVLSEAGYFFFGLMGVAENIRTTEVLRLQVKQGALTAATAEPKEPTPDIYQQLVAAYGVAESRVSELIAMRGPHSSLATDVSEDYINGTIKTNGVNAYINLSVIALNLIAGGTHYTDFCVRAPYLPLSSFQLESSDPNIEVTMELGEEESAGWARFVIHNTLDSMYMTDAYCTATYPLAEVYIDELADIRIGANGAVYDTAGDAVRAQGKALNDLESAVEEINEKTSGYRSTSINLILLENASPKGEWWYQGVKYTSGNANTDASCSFQVPVKPNTTYYAADYYADTLSRHSLGCLYYNLMDATGKCISSTAAQGEFLTTADAAYVIVTFKMYASKEAEAPIYLPYFSEVPPPDTRPAEGGEPITFEYLLDEINKLKAPESKEPLFRLAKKYDLVVGDTFELFYYGIVNCAKWEGFYVKATGAKGHCYRNRFTFTPAAADVGTHTITFALYDNQMTFLEEASVDMVVHAKATAPASQKVILCVGDSLFNGGVVPDEFHRRLCGSGGAPAGEALSNISFIGTQQSTSRGVPYEGYGGWTFDSYNTEFKHNSFVWITAVGHGKTEGDQHSIYKDSSGKLWRLETIEANRIKLVGDTVSQSLSATSGSLTWVSGGVNQAKISYTAAEVASGNPFWNATTGAVDFANYASKCGVSRIDHVYILLGWNSVGASAENYKTAATTFISNLRKAFPNCTVTLVGLQKPSLDGIGENYGAHTTYNYLEMQGHVWAVESVYEALAKELSGVACINLSGQFDTENNMLEWTRPVNARNAKTETYQNNGVHPSQSGLFQIADAMYRDFTAKY